MRISGRRSRWIVVAFAVACVLSTRASAHPGSGIVVDREGQIYFVDTGSGVWKIDTHGTLTRHPGLAYHWMTIDVDGRFANVRLPSGSTWGITQAGANPTLILASDFPIAVGRDGNLYYPLPGPDGRVQVIRLMPSGHTSVLATLPAETESGPLRFLNGIAAGPDGSIYYTENNAIRKITAQGQVSTVMAGIPLAGCAPIPGAGADYRPLLRGLDVDARGTVYVAASGCGSVMKVTPDGQVSTILQLQSPWSPTGVVVSGSDLYVLEYLHTASDNRRDWLPRVRKISPDGKAAIIASVDRR